MPATVKPFILRGFNGRNGASPENIKETQFQTLQNWYTKNNVLVPRAGMAPLTNIAYGGEKITGLFFYSPSYSSYKLIAACADSIAVKDGSTFSALPSTSGTTITDADTLWVAKQYKNTLYLVRPDLGVVMRCDGTTVGDVGIAAPGTAATGAEGAAGALEAGDYEFVVTFYNTVTGAESDPSPVGTVTVGASKSIDYSAIPVSTNPQVNARKIYRSLIDQAGEWFHVATISDNVTTTYSSEDLELDEMGFPAEAVHGIPPTGIKNLTTHQERMWYHDGRFLYYSEIGLPESVRATSSLDINADDGYLMTGLISFGETLLVMKQNAIYYVSGSDEQSFIKRVLHDKHGCASAASVAISENLCFWFGGDNFYISDGAKVEAIGTEEVQDIVSSISASDYGLVTGETNPEEGWYMVSIPSSGAVSYWLVYCYRTGDWFTFSFQSSKTPTFISRVPDENGNTVLYCALENDDGLVYTFLSGVDDAGTSIVYTLKSKNYGFGTEDTMKFMKDIQLLINTTGVAEDITVSLYADDSLVAKDTASFNTFGNKMWKRIPLANNGDLGTFMSLGVTYTGDSNFFIMGLGFKIVDTGRQVPVL